MAWLVFDVRLDERVLSDHVSPSKSEEALKGRPPAQPMLDFKFPLLSTFT